MHPLRIGLAIASLAVACGPPPAATPVAEPGPYAVDRWMPAEAPLREGGGLYYPVDAPCPGAPVIIGHGGGAWGEYYAGVAHHLASWGLVAVAPTWPGRLRHPDARDADLAVAMLDWVVAAGAREGTPIAGKVDGERAGVVGHSYGGIVLEAAAIDPRIAAVVAWDAAAGLESAPDVRASSLFLFAASESGCGTIPRTGYEGAPEPKAEAVVEGASHCDFSDPPLPLCPSVCETPAWDPEVAARIERLSTAWLVCALGHHPEVAEALDLADQGGLAEVEQVGAIDCRPAACEE